MERQEDLSRSRIRIRYEVDTREVNGFGERVRYFGSVWARVYGGDFGEKTMGLDFKPDEVKNAKKLAQSILKAVEDGREIRITIHAKPDKEGLKHVTVLSQW